jgi:hypothetical protein
MVSNGSLGSAGTSAPVSAVQERHGAPGGIDLLSERARVKCGRDEPWTRIDVLKELRKKP